jgi:hypothetical protein
MKIQKKIMILVLAAMAIFSLIPLAGAGETSGSMILILDASGSMWGQIDKKDKISIAKESMVSIIGNLPDDIEVGLLAYGHNRKGDCKDVQTLMPLKKIDKPQLVSKIKRLNAKGKTPISLAIKKAAEALKSREEETTIILVSDGKETCASDPCEVTRALKESGVKFVLHVVGFDVSEEERTQLQCIADAGGGKYYTARNAEQLGFAVNSVAKSEKKENRPASGEGRVWFDNKPVVTVPGGIFTVNFEAAETFHKNAWLGIIPADIPHGKEVVNDRHNFAYEYIDKRLDGKAILTAPAREGKYDVRLHDSDTNGREIASVGFEVRKQLGEISIDRTDFITGEKIEFSFKAPQGISNRAWVGTVPSNIPHGSEEQNDKHDVNYVYLKGNTSGKLSLPAPTIPGRYDLRMHDTNDHGNEIAHVSFVVEKAIADIWLDKEQYVTGQTIEYNFSAPPGMSKKAWVGVVPSDIAHGSEDLNDKHDVNYMYLKGRKEGKLWIYGPSKPGKWDLRLHDSNDHGNEIAHASFSVVMATAEMKLEKTEFLTGEMISGNFITSEGLNKKAWIGLVPAEIPHGSEDKNDAHDVAYIYLGGKSNGTFNFKGPVKPGKWDLRLHDTNNHGNEIAHVTFNVKLCVGSLSLEKATFAPKENIQLSFSVPVKIDPKAWVGLFPASAPHGNDDQNDAHDLDYQYVGSQTSGIFNFKAPEKTGKYDFRLHDSNNKGNEIAVVVFTVK